MTINASTDIFTIDTNASIFTTHLFTHYNHYNTNATIFFTTTGSTFLPPSSSNHLASFAAAVLFPLLGNPAQKDRFSQEAEDFVMSKRDNSYFDKCTCYDN